MFRKKRKKIVVPATKRFLPAKIGFICLLIVLVIGVGFFLYHWYVLRKSSYLSPLAKSGGNSNSSAIQNSEIEQELQQARIGYSQITYSQNSATVTLSNNNVVILSLSKNIKYQIATLQLITTRLTIEGKKFISVNFLFDKPIITF